MLKTEELRLNIKKKVFFYFSLFFLISFPFVDIYSSFSEKDPCLSSQHYTVSSIKKDALPTLIEYTLYFSSLFISRNNILPYSAVAFSSLSLVYSLKKLIKRERPDKSDFKSFPSGHTAVTFLSLIFILKNIKEKQKIRTILFIFSSLIMILMISNRVLTKRHYISDTFFSIIIVTCAYFFTHKILSSFFLIKKTND